MTRRYNGEVSCKRVAKHQGNHGPRIGVLPHNLIETKKSIFLNLPQKEIKTIKCCTTYCGAVHLRFIIIELKLTHSCIPHYLLVAYYYYYYYY